jgi:hypothetical protein
MPAGCKNFIGNPHLRSTIISQRVFGGQVGVISTQKKSSLPVKWLMTKLTTGIKINTIFFIFFLFATRLP